MKKEETQKIYDFLYNNDYIVSNSTIDSEILKELIGCGDVDDMEYIGPLILIAKEIEKHTGLFCKLIEKGIHIYSEEECVYISKKRADKAQRINNDTYKTLLKTNLRNISDQTKRSEHLHQINIFCMLNRNSKLILSQVDEEE